MSAPWCLASSGLQFDKVNLQVGDLQRLGNFSLYSIYHGFNSTNMGIFGELEIDLPIGFLDFLGWKLVTAIRPARDGTLGDAKQEEAPKAGHQCFIYPLVN